MAGATLACAMAVVAVLASSSAAAPEPALKCHANPYTVHRVPDDPNAPYRLSRDVIPEHYDLRIVTNLGDGGVFDFSGHVDIKVKVIRDTTKFRLHARELDVDPVKVASLGDKNVVSVKSQTLNSDDEVLELELAEPLREGQAYSLSMKFAGNLTAGLHGLYRSSYHDKKTNTHRWLAVSHFEATHAREAFPCFDEPAMKATFTVSIGHNSSLHALSNMPAEKTEPLDGHPGYALTSFGKSVPMSTYLVAFIVSDFEGRFSEKKKGEAIVGIWARRDAIAQVEYARELGPRALRFFEEYFEEKYPLPKQDMVAIPDFSAGAMENWGLITYREAQLLYDPEVTSVTTKGHLANTVVHELAHQWFGNLVTMQWWSDLWLNEGFATYMATLGTSTLNPDWDLRDENTVDNALLVLSLDALNSTHPVVRPIGHPTQISQSFDTITYKKGSALLKMMQAFLGEEVFRQGVANYIKEHKYNNAEQDDLWQALTAEAHRHGTLSQCLSVKQVMDTWTVQSGYPLVTVERDYANGSATIRQARYMSDPRQRSDSTCWYVPLSYTDQDVANFKELTPKDWLTCQGSDHVITNMAAKDKWVIFNIGLAGVYRVQYDDHNWDLLIAALSDPAERRRIGVLNRVQLLMDSFDLARSGRLSYSIPLRIANTLELEDHPFPWRAGLSGLAGLDLQAIRTGRYDEFRVWIRRLLSPVAKREAELRLVRDGFQAKKHKTTIISWACKFEVEDCVDQARELFKDWRDSKEPDVANPVPRDLRSVVYCSAMKFGTSNDWSWLWQRYLNSNVASERVTILSALGCSRDIWQLRRYLEWGIDESSGVRLQDSSYVFSAVASTEVGYSVARDFLYQRAGDITKHYGGPSTSRIGRYVTDIGRRILTDKEYEEFQNFTKREERFLTGADQSVRQALESAGINVQWRKDHLEEVFGAIVKMNAAVKS